MSNPITYLNVEPNYDRGFQFSWGVGGDMVDPAPWSFCIEESDGAPDHFQPISPVLTGRYRWSENQQRITNKDAVLYFRIRFTTPNGTYYSEPVAPWGNLERREYLLARDIMRREVVHARTLAGILGSLWIRNVYGPRCPVCVDPITQQIRNSRCTTCLGTGYVPPYCGPYETWMQFSTDTSTIEMSADGAGTLQPRAFEVRCIGTPPIRHGDVLVDPQQDKRYIVAGSKALAEIRRVPVVQQISCQEAPTTDPVYRLTS